MSQEMTGNAKETIDATLSISSMAMQFIGESQVDAFIEWLVKRRNKVVESGVECPDVLSREECLTDLIGAVRNINILRILRDTQNDMHRTDMAAISLFPEMDTEILIEASNVIR